MKTNLPRACLLALPFLLFGFGIAHAQCKSGEILIGEDADNYYCIEKAKYEGSSAQQTSQQFCQAKKAVAADQAAIKAFGLNADSKRLADLTERLEGHVKAMSELKKTWQTETGYSKATPVCAR